MKRFLKLNNIWRRYTLDDILVRHASFKKAVMSDDSTLRRRGSEAPPTSPKPPSVAPSQQQVVHRSFSTKPLVSFGSELSATIRSLPGWTTPLLSLLGGALVYWFTGRKSFLVGVGGSVVTGAVVLLIRLSAGDKPSFMTPLFEECVENLKTILKTMSSKLQADYRESKYPLFLNLMLLKLFQTRKRLAMAKEDRDRVPIILDDRSEGFLQYASSAFGTPLNTHVITTVYHPTTFFGDEPVGEEVEEATDEKEEEYKYPKNDVEDADVEETMNTIPAKDEQDKNIDDDSGNVSKKVSIASNLSSGKSSKKRSRKTSNWSERGSRVSRRIIREMTGLDDNAIVVMELEGEKALLPRYFVAIDDARFAVVLCIRGTMSLSDILTDACADCVSFLGLGISHRGMGLCAVRLADETQNFLNSILEENPGYDLVVCGHSLGAGAATLTTMVFLHRQDAGKLPSPLCETEISCYAYAPPPTFAPVDAVPQRWRQCIYTFVNGADVVPRLSLASVCRLLRDILAVDGCDLSFKQRLELIVKCSKGDEESLDILETHVESATSAVFESDFPCLYLVGRVIWINRDHTENLAASTCELCEPADIERGGIEVLENFITDHFPSIYRKVFREIREAESLKIKQKHQQEH